MTAAKTYIVNNCRNRPNSPTPTAIDIKGSFVARERGPKLSHLRGAARQTTEGLQLALERVLDYDKTSGACAVDSRADLQIRGSSSSAIDARTVRIKLGTFSKRLASEQCHVPSMALLRLLELAKWLKRYTKVVSDVTAGRAQHIWLHTNLCILYAWSLVGVRPV
eukprot:5309287-Pleurochrysis_carterae.AAC.1